MRVRACVELGGASLRVCTACVRETETETDTERETDRQTKYVRVCQLACLNQTHK